ncbi:MAG: non-ribosomal peptide synthase/polyketide synthase [Acidobacteria bacterium]|nr:non-ribosomal peptide synthase/polyketide synthase [Acidobacteriota bacterium]
MKKPPERPPDRPADRRPEFRSLQDVLRWRARESPEDAPYVFLSDGEVEAGRLTYRDLDVRARALGALLQERRMQGERVLLLYPPGLDYLAAFFGCLYAGATAVPAYPPRQNRSLARLRAVIADARPRIALTTAAILARIEGWLAEAPDLGSLAWEATDGLDLRVAADWEEPAAGAASIAFIQYTSGSTGSPKGVVLSHGNLLHNLELMRSSFRFGPGSRGVIWLPPYHDMGLIGGILQPLYTGFPVTLMSPAAFLQRPVRWLQAISRTRATSSAGPNFAYDLCARRVTPEEVEALDLSCWQVAINGAEPVRAEALERFAARFAPCGFRPEAFCPSYGLAEATLIVSGGWRSRPPRVRELDAAALEQNRAEPPGDGGGPVRRLVGCGEVSPGQAVHIVDPETRSPLPPGSVGEIWVAGPSVAQGYWQRREETAAVFGAAARGEGPARFLRTGDLGFFAGGELFVTGRLKDLIILRGRNLYPQDVELAAERAHPALAAGSGAAFSVEAEGEERLVVVYEAARGRSLDVAEVAAAVRRAVAAEFEVQVFDLVLVRTATIPKTTSGKIQRRACREAYLAATLTLVGRSTAAALPPEAAAPGWQPGPRALRALDPGERRPFVEELLRNALADVAHVDRRGIAADLSPGGLGLDSLMTLELKHRVELETGASLSWRELLESPALSDLADLVLERLDAAPPAELLPDVAEAEAGDAAGTQPLSPGQKGLWFLERLSPESGAYNIAGAARTAGPLDAGALRRALASLLERHPLLRAAVVDESGVPRLWLRESADVDLAAEVSDRRGPSLASRLAREAYRPFDLARDPLLRMRIFDREGTGVVLLVVHHLVADFWSLAVLVRELAAFYRGETAGTPVLLPAIPCRYSDFVRWQERRLAGPEGERLWDFWRQRLAGASRVLDLPTDRPRPTAQGHRGAAVRIGFDAALSERLRTLSAGHGATLYMTLLAAFQLLLHRLAGQRDLLVGTATAGRNAAPWADVVGYFTNPVVLRSELEGGERFRDLLARTRRETLEAFEHQDLPFALLADRLQPARDPSRSPLFQAMLVFQRAPAGEEALAAFALGQPGARLDLGGLPLESVDWEERRSRFDLLVTAAELDGTLAAALEYPLDLFDATTMQRLAGQLAALLAEVAADPDGCALDLPLLSAAERHQLQQEWNGAAAVPLGRERWREACLHDLFEERAGESPDAPAVTCGAQRLTYRELSRRSNQLAGHLRTLGVGPQTLVGLCLERSPEMVVAILGVLKAGGAYVPLDPAYPQDRLAFCLEDSRVPVLITEDRLAGSLPETRARRVCLDTQRDLLDRQSGETPRSATLPQDPAYVIYTSGSTGRPKGVLVRHANVVRLFAATEEWFGFGPDDVWTLFHSYAFDFSVWEIWGALLYGGRLVVVPQAMSRSPAAFLELVRRERVTVLNQTPSAFRPFVRAELAEMAEMEAAGQAAAKALALRLVIFGGEALELRSLAPWFDRHGDRHPRLVNMYGITETTVHVTYRPVRREDLESGRGSVIGRAIPDLRLWVLDARMQALPIGAPGELYVGGAGVAAGYLDRPELTAERFLPALAAATPGERAYRTGDLVRYLPDGDLEYLGRIDQQVKVRGFRIELAEIEGALARHPAVGAAVVAARPDDAGPARLTAYVVSGMVSGATAPVTASELHRWVAASLPEYMVPAAFVFLESLPLTPSGKVDRQALPEPDRLRPRLEGEYVAPRSATEALLAGIWAGVLGVERVGVRDNFFELGGDSILSLQVVARAGDDGLRITPRQMFLHQTVEELAGVAAAGAAPGAATDPGPAEAPLAPVQRWFFERELAARNHYNQAVLLATRPGVRPERLAAAIEHVVAHHDALRLRFVRTGPEWMQAGGGAGPVPPLSRLDLLALPPERRTPALEAAAAALQASLDVERGPLLRAACFELGGDAGGRLLLVIHHLAVDAVSWRILLEDLERAYRRLEEGREVALPAATPYRLWARAEAARAEAARARLEAAEAELSQWLQPRRPPARVLPLDGTGGPNTEGSAREVSVELETGPTRALLREVPRLHRARADEALLAALVRALAPPPGSAVRIDVETHGRDEAAGIDLSRAVGWFTAIVPVWLEAAEAGSAAAALRAVQEQVRPALERGSAFWRLRNLSPDAELRARLRAVPAAEVLFNYLGQLDPVLAGSALFAPAEEPLGDLRGGQGGRSHALEVEARVTGGRLRVAFRFSARLCSRATIERLAERFARSLRELIPDLPEPGIEDVYPLSPTQEGLLFHSLFAPDSGVYVTQIVCELRGELDLPAFEQAWADLLTRHPALRTAFSWRDGEEPCQRVHARLSVPVERLDWREADDGPERIEELLRTDRERGFDPAAAPLMRLYLIRLPGGDRHLLVWSHHHLLLDGWSVAALVKELFVTYGARRQGKRPWLEPPRPYADFIAWLQAQDLGAAEAFWRGMFAGFEASTPLGIDLAPASAATAGSPVAERGLALAPQVTDELRQMARRHHLTLSLLLQAAWSLLLSRYSGEEEVVFGATFSGRPPVLAGVEAMIGLFINALPVRVAVPAGGRLLPWLAGLQALNLELRQHEHSPLSQVQRWAGQPAGAQLFDSLVVFENYPVDDALRQVAQRATGLEIVAVRSREQTHYPLTLAGVPGESLTLRALYDGRRFAGPAVDRLLGHLSRLLGALAAAPDVPLQDLPMLSGTERHQVMVEWSSAAQGETGAWDVVRAFEAQVDRTPEAPAVSFAAESLTYRELDRRANRLAHRLRSLGVGPDVPVALLTERSLEMIVALLGILKAGGAYAPLDPASPPDRLALLLGDLGAPVVLVQEHLLGRLPESGGQVVLLAAGREGIESGSPERPAVWIDPESLAYVMHTSGSTGRPKGVAVVHRAVVRLVRGTEFADFGPDQVWSQLAPVSFDVSVLEIWGALLNGGRLAVLPPGPLALAELGWELSRGGVTSLWLAAGLFHQMVDESLAGLALVRQLVAGGDVLSPEHVRKALTSLPGCRLINGYGPTENTTFTCCHPMSLPEEVASPVPLGRPIAGTQAWLLDPELRPVPLEVAGELYAGGSGLARGYLNRPDLTAERFIPDPCSGVPGERLYRTGDRARWRTDGTVEFLGRIDNQVKLRGFRVELGEVEAVLVTHPAVLQAVVVMQGAGEDRRLVAFVVGEADDADDAENAELRGYLAPRLPAWMVPSAFVVLETLPLTPNGKVDRKALLAMAPAAQPETAFVVPHTPAEELLAAMWAEVLGREAVGVHDDFFALGGHSLLATRLAARVHAAFGVDLPLHRLFASPTVAGLARELEERLAGERGKQAPPVKPAPGSGPVPLSFGQERLWFLELFEPGTGAYNVPVALRIEGPLDVPALERSFGELILRHEALRTALPADAEGRPVQVVQPWARFTLPVADLRGLPRAESEARRLAVAAARRPLDLERGPLFRVALLTLDESDHVLLATFHHAVCDEGSMRLLVDELGVCYGAFTAGGQPQLQPLPVQLADHAVWQRTWVQGETLAAELGYWRQRLRGAPAVLALPADRPRPPVWRSRGATRRLSLAGEQAAALDRAARGARVTPFMFALAAFHALLHRYTGQDDLVVGTPVASRGRLELEGLVGFLGNTLMIRARCAGEEPFSGVLREVRRAVLEAHAHQDLPFEKLVEELHGGRDLSHQALFQALFVMHEAPWRPPALGASSVHRIEVDLGVARFDWTLALERREDGLTISIEYATDLYDAATAQRVLRHYAHLLAGAASAPESRVADLPLLAEAERHQLLQDWNDTRRPGRRATVHERIAARAREHPAAVAVTFEGESLTYGELEAGANGLARDLERLGVGPEVPVAVCVERSLELLPALLGVWKAGGAYVPLDPSYPQERLESMLADSGAPVLLTQRRLASLLTPGAAQVVHLDAGLPRTAAADAADAGTAVAAGQAAYVIYTSGSTGRPKGVQVLHGALANFLDAMQGELALGAGDRLLAVTSLSFDIAGLELFLPLLVGAEVALCSREEATDGRRLRARLESGGITAMQATPATWRLLRDAGWQGDGHLKILCGGEALDPALAGGLAGSGGGLWNLYGPTETTIWSALARLDGGDVTLGRPLANTEVHLLDRSSVLVPAGVPGALFIGGDGLARGYLGRPHLTAERFLPDPFSGRPGARLYATGDLARRRPDGRLEFLGRLDHQVKVRGFRIELGEVEAVLARHPGVRQTAVTAHPAGGSLVAYVVTAGATAPSASELREHLRRHLPEHSVPSAYVVMEAFPLTPNGKVDRKALPAPGGARPGAGERRAPRTPVEGILAGIFASLLGVERVGAEDDFFLLGGHSLLAAQVLTRVRAAFGVELPVRALFEAPRLADLAHVVEQRRRAGEASAPPPIQRADRSRPLPLSFGQQRLWFLDRLEPGSPLYNMPAALHLEGDLDVRALHGALAEIVRRQQALRTVYPAVDGRPVQRVTAAAVFPLPVVDLRRAGPAGEELRRLISDDAVRPFELSRGPVLRVTLLRLGEREHLVLFNLHHIAGDAWSLEILLRELSVLYAALTAGRPSPLPELGIQYADFASWQRSWLTGEVLAEQLRYWRQRLAGAPEALAISTDRPRSAHPGDRGGSRPVRIPADLAGRLRELGGREGATPFMVLLSALQALLGRLAGQEDVLTGTTVAGRRRLEVEDLIGFFVNTLVLRTELSGGPAFGALVARVREESLNAFAHQDLPFEQLVEELQPDRSLGRTPLFQVLFAFAAEPRDGFALGSLRARPRATQTGTAKFDLSLLLREEEGGWAGDLEYRAELFDAPTVERLARQVERLLGAVAADFGMRLFELPLLSGEERHQLLVEWNEAGQDGAPEACIHHLFEAQAGRDPEAIAVQSGAERLSYGELDRRAGRLARRLRRLGVGPDVLVGVCLERSCELVTSLLAVLKAGGAYVPLDPSHPAERLGRQLADAWGDGPVRLLLTHSRLAPSLADLLPAGARVLSIDAPGELAGAGGSNPGIRALPEQAAYVIYTSGSTGRPKGVVISHGALANLVAWHRRTYAVTPSDRASLVASPGFDASVWEIWPYLAAGASLHVPAEEVRASPARLVSWLVEREISLAFLPTPLAEAALAEEWPADMPLRALLTGGDRLHRGPRPGLKFTLYNHYGPTENTVVATFTPVAATAPGDPPPIGQPIASTRAYVLDRHLRALPVGIPGELALGGESLARGYLNQPELTAERFVPDPFAEASDARLYRTGDLVRWSPAGDLEFLARIDQQVKVRGFRIEPGEIESALGAHSGVLASAVLARAGATGADRSLVAYVAVAAGGPGAEELRRWLRSRLPELMVPTEWKLLAELPLTANGKVDRAALLRLPPDGEIGGGSAPQTPFQELLAGLWSAVLGRERVSAEDDFFALGGHSLLAVQLASRVRDSFGLELPLRTLLEESSLAGQAARIEAALRAGQGMGIAGPRLEPVPRAGELPVSPAQERLWFLAQVDPESAAFNIPSALRVDGPLDARVLAHALSEVVRRHETLRTAFLAVGGRPTQMITPPVPLPLPVVDLRGLPPDARDREARRLATEAARQAFALARPPLLRARLLWQGPQEHVLLLTVHHIVADGWSLGVLVREVTALYTAFAAGRPSPLPELPLQYADFAAWQRRWLAGPTAEAQLAYWRRQLAGAPEVLALPTDRPRPESRTFRGAHRVSGLPDGLSRALRALSRQEGATLFMTLLAGFQTFLHVLTRQEDVVVGTDVASRNRTELEAQVGFFINHLVLRTRFSGNPTFREVLQGVRETCLGAYAHQDLPFVRLVKALSPKRSLSHMPLFQALFVLQNAPAAAPEVGGLRFQAVDFDFATSRFDLALFVSETEQGLAMSWNYSTELFDPGTIDRFASRLEGLLEQVVAQPDTRVSRLELVVQREKEPRNVETKPHQESPFKKRTLQRQSVDLSNLNPVRSRPLLPDPGWPLLVEPAGAEVDLADWAVAHRADLEAWLATHGAILLRGFGLGSVAEFERSASAICPNLFADYGDLPRQEGAERIYHSTPYPADKAILFHNESSHLGRWPLRQMFFCVQPAQAGGETPIVDCREVYRRLDPAITRPFEEKGLMYVRNFTDGLDVNWRDFFHTADQAAVEAACRQAGMQLEWRQDGLTTRQICPAVTVHPRTGEKIFFNQLQLHHPACLDPEIRASLLALFPEERLPRNVFYGDGSPIAEDVVRAVLDLYWRLSVSFPWQPGDLLLLDNMLVAHARNPFAGPRKIAVAMGELYPQQAS